MAKSNMPEVYIGREQAYVKHTILKTYLQRLFMIVGRNKEEVVNYVDCLSGPWKEEDYNLSDTSIGVSLEQMVQCKKTLEEQTGRAIKFRALYVEKDPVAFEKLESFLLQQQFPQIEVKCLNGDYTKLLNDIVKWCDGHFTFFFVDPKGWKSVVGAKTMLPLLRLNKAEFLINLMYEFINRFVSLENHSDDMVELFGEVPNFKDESPEQRQDHLLMLYRNNMKKRYGGRTAYVPVHKPGKERVLYYLVYLTRSPRGIDVFKAEAEKMEIVQRITQNECKLRRQLEQAGTLDMFGSDVDVQPTREKFSDNRLEAKQYLLARLSHMPTLIDFEKWADFLEESDLYPSDLQMAAKELVKAGLVTNLDADVKRRRTIIIKPSWKNKSERWMLA